MHLKLGKYHGLGNDFLVVVDWENRLELDAALAVALCDRHRGVGADGVLHLSAPVGGGTIAMVLRNADGGVAETSGNGVRCAALAALDAGVVDGPRIAVETAVGVAAVELEGRGPFGAELRVEMGTVRVGAPRDASELDLGPDSGAIARDELAALKGRSARFVDVGNPHLVIVGQQIVDPLARVPLERLGAAIEASVPGGVNVEVVAPIGTDALLLDVWERGAGITLACGSGSCAAAAAARADGLVGDRVRVANPGGSLVVELAGPPEAPKAVLIGPARRVAAVEVDTDDLERVPLTTGVATP